MDLILHKYIENDKLKQIAELKSLAWPDYSQEDHLRWMLLNLKPYDTHVLNYSERLESYVNVFSVYVEIDGYIRLIKGTGNLCSRGGMSGYLLNKKILRPGGLYLGFCKDHLKDFYRHMGWKFPFTHELHCPFITKDYNVMTYGITFRTLTYTGKRF